MGGKSSLKNQNHFFLFVTILCLHYKMEISMKYICIYGIPNEKIENRMFALSRNDKVDYIVTVMNDMGLNIEMISASMSSNNKGFYKQRKDVVNNRFSIISGPTFGTKSGIKKQIQKFYSLSWLLMYLIRNCKKGEWVAVYHSVFYAIPLLIAKKMKKIRILNEIEELFYELNDNTSSWRKRLENTIINKSDAYIFASKELERKCNVFNKPFVIANGNYTCSKIVASREDDLIKLVYAGLIESGKVAFKSAEIAKYLSEEYQIRIIGYGSDRAILEMKQFIDEINAYSKCKVVYDGVKRGLDYQKYLQQCHIGLCPISNNVRFQNACFPSKITSYIANGLHVITTDNEVVRNSEYVNAISFVNGESPKEFAEVVIKLKNKNLTDSRNLVHRLDIKFRNSIYKMIMENGIKGGSFL